MPKRIANIRASPHDWPQSHPPGFTQDELDIKHHQSSPICAQQNQLRISDRRHCASLCGHDLRSREPFLDDQLLSTPHLDLLNLRVRMAVPYWRPPFVACDSGFALCRNGSCLAQRRIEPAGLWFSVASPSTLPPQPAPSAPRFHCLPWLRDVRLSTYGLANTPFNR